MSSSGDIRVLHVDDDPEFVEVAASHLERTDDAITVLTETSARAALDRLRSASVDCVVSDHDMPGMDGLEFLESVRAEFPDLPVILFTGKGNEEIASDAISAGVTEYLQKDVGTDQYTVLANRVRRVVGESRTKSALVESQRRFSTLIDTLPGMVYRARDEPDWPMEYVSEGVEELVGYDAEVVESGAVPWRSLVADGDRDRVAAAVRQSLATGDRFEVRYRVETESGDTRWLLERGRAVGTTDGGTTLVEGFVTDVTDHEDRQRELDQYRTLVEAVGDPVYALDEEGRFTFVNEAIEPMTGYSPSELVGEHIGTIMTGEDVERGDALIESLLTDAEENSGTLEMDVVTKGGEQTPSENNLALLPARDGRFTGTAGIIRDIHERKEREQRLAEFASVVSHDLRNPLNVVQGRLELARETGDVSHLEAATEAAGRMEQLIDDLLTLARQGDTVGTLDTVDLATAAEDAWRNVDTVGAILEPAETGTFEADPDRLRELLENLFRNSVEHGRPEPYEDVVAANSRDRRPPDDAIDHERLTVTVGTMATENGATGFYVADDGQGIPEGERDSVFERGYTTATDGTGFGLAIVEDIAEAHGWTIGVTESGQGGARFEFTTSSSASSPPADG
jgi:PAS domain S-box-containing protein